MWLRWWIFTLTVEFYTKKDWFNLLIDRSLIFDFVSELMDWKLFFFSFWLVLYDVNWRVKEWKIYIYIGIKDASDKKILVDMLFWAVDNPAPSNYLLISGDRDFSNALHQLRMRRYNILLAQPHEVSAPLVAAAKSVWLWTSLVAGGPPLPSGESLLRTGDFATFNSENEPVQASRPMGNTNTGRVGDTKLKGKHVNKPTNQPSISRAAGTPVGNGNNSRRSFRNQHPLPSRPYHSPMQPNFPQDNFLPHNSHNHGFRPMPPKPTGLDYPMYPEPTGWD